MKRPLLFSAAILAAGVLMWSARAQIDSNAAHPSVTLELGAGSTVLLERRFATVLIGNPDIINVQTQTERSVLLKPLRTGATNVVFIDEQGMVIKNLAIVVRNAQTI